MKFVNRKFVWLILSLIMFSHQANAQDKIFDESVLSGKGKQAYQTLLKIKLFAIGGVGYSGETSEGENAFNVLLDEKEAVSAFKILVDKATIEGGLYSLAALQWLKCDCYKEQLENFKKARLSNENDERLSWASGCSGYETKEKEGKSLIIETVEKGQYNGIIESRRKVREQHKFLEKQKQDSNGVNKNQ